MTTPPIPRGYRLVSGPHIAAEVGEGWDILADFTEDRAWTGTFIRDGILCANDGGRPRKASFLDEDFRDIYRIERVPMSNLISVTDFHLLPANSYPGLLDGWCGPAVMPDGEIVVVQHARGDRVFVVGSDRNLHPRPYQPASICLDLHRPEGIDRAIRVLKAGAKCETCGGDPVTVRRNSHGDADPASPIAFPSTCAACGGTGHRIQPADLSWVRDLPEWQAGPILAASVLRVAAGEGPVRNMVRRVSPEWAVSQGRAYYDDYNGDDHILVPLTDGKVARVEAP